MIKIPDATATTASDAVVDLLDAAATAGTLVLYDGAEPATANDALAGNNTLVTFTLDDPAFGDATPTANGGRATANPIASQTASASGTASFFRLSDGNGNVVMQGEVTEVGNGGDIELSSTNLVAGIDVTITSFTVTMPLVDPTP